MKRKVLMTGASGRIGRFLTAHLPDRYDLVLSDIVEPADTRGFSFVKADITDFEAVLALCQGVDTVIHLAANPNMEAVWESLLPLNIEGAYHVFEAAHQAGCRRVIFASSINAVFGYPPDVQVHANMPTRPPNLYGATKVWGEAVACYYADQKNISTICLRFGWVVDRGDPSIRLDHPYLDITLTYHDLTKLIAASIDAPDEVRFGIFHGLSDNRWKRLDIRDTQSVLGYEPEDDGFAIARINEQESL